MCGSSYYFEATGGEEKKGTKRNGNIFVVTKWKVNIVHPHTYRANFDKILKLSLRLAVISSYKIYRNSPADSTKQHKMRS